MAISVWRRLDLFPCDCQFNIAFLCKEITDHVCQDEDRHSWMIIAQECLEKRYVNDNKTLLKEFILYYCAAV